MRPAPRACLATSLGAFLWILTITPASNAGEPIFRRHRRAPVETMATTTRPQDRVAPTGMLGTFVPTPTVMIRDNGPIGGGYSPLGQYGFGNAMSVFGPLSAFRETTAPVNTVVRGYNGVPTVVQGISFSNPNQPTLSPFIYPTRASNYSALRYQATPPYRDKGLMWIDQN